MKTLLYAGTILLLAACSSQSEIEIPEEIAALENLTIFPADAEPQYEISLTKEATYGDVDDILLGSWLTAMVDKQERVFVADNQEKVIHLYNPDGSYNRQIGREGEGPGEYRNIGDMQTDETYFYLMDRDLRKFTKFDLETFEVVEDFAIPAYPSDDDDDRYRYANSFYLLPGNQYLVRFGMPFMGGSDGSEDDVRKIEGRILDPLSQTYQDENLFSFPDSEALVHREGGSMMVMFSIPYKRSSVVTYQNDLIYHGWSEDFLLKIYDSEGNYQRAIYYPYPNIPLDRNAVMEIYADREKRWRDMVRNDNMPETWPVFYDFTVDDEGRFWVQMVTEDTDASEYVVLDETGELLGQVPWNRGNQIQQITNGSIYVMEEDEMGLREIVKYRVEFI